MNSKTITPMNQTITRLITDRMTGILGPKILANGTRVWRTVLALLICALPLALQAAEPPKVGDRAPDFTLNTLDNQTVHLSELTAKGNLVLGVLRASPGYQCPVCDRQVQDFIASASGFAEAKTHLVFVYPGPANDLKARAEQFKNWKGKQWPKEFLYVLDPDYLMVSAYNLRWDAPLETAYPSP